MMGVLLKQVLNVEYLSIIVVKHNPVQSSAQVHYNCHEDIKTRSFSVRFLHSWCTL